MKHPNFLRFWQLSQVFWKILDISFQMSHRQPHWRQYCPIGSHLNFFCRVTPKIAKKVFFYIRTIYSSFWYWYPNPGYHHEKAQVLSFPKMLYFLGVRRFKGELSAVKVNRLWNFESVTKNKRCCKKKTRPQFWNPQDVSFNMVLSLKNFPSQKCRGEGILAKNAVFAISHCRPKKFFKWLPIGQFWS